MRRTSLATTLALGLTLALAGCIENMGDLKETLGVVEPVPPPPEYRPPFAKASTETLDLLVGQTAAFSARGSRDAQGLALTYFWSFGDGGIARAVEARHAYATPGEYRVRLEVSNAAGLKDTDTLTILVRAPDLPPTAALRILDATGAPAVRGAVGSPLTFEAQARDPEGAPLTYVWDLGGGVTSVDERPTHTYARPGTYAVSLTVRDALGQKATALAPIAVDAAWSETGAFTLGGANEHAIDVVVPRAARALSVDLTFEAGAGVNDVEIVVRDATGAEVARSVGEGQPGAQGGATRALVLDAATLAAYEPGDWTITLVRERGLSATWSLAATLTA